MAFLNIFGKRRTRGGGLRLAQSRVKSPHSSCLGRALPSPLRPSCPPHFTTSHQPPATSPPFEVRRPGAWLPCGPGLPHSHNQLACGGASAQQQQPATLKWESPLTLLLVHPAGTRGYPNMLITGTHAAKDVDAYAYMREVSTRRQPAHHMHALPARAWCIACMARRACGLPDPAQPSISCRWWWC